MKNTHYKTLTLNLLIALFMVVALPIQVSAYNRGNDAYAEQSDDSDVAHANEASEATLTDEQIAAKRTERIDKNKAALQEKLAAAEQQRIASRCKNAQKQIANHTARFDKLKDNRARVYSDVVDKIQKLSEKLDAAGADTTQLNVMIEELKTMVHDFSELGINHAQSVSDLEEMDCAADPEAFKATLLALRAEWKNLHDEAKAIRSYVIETIKPELLKIKATLVKTEDTTVESESETNGTTESTGNATGGTN